MPKDDLERAIARGTAAALSHYQRRWFSNLKYTITTNPYDRRGRKKEHVAWHNAFYNQRKLMDKPVM